MENNASNLNLCSLVDRFKKGENLPKETISKIFGYITNKPQTYFSYMDCIKRIKSILNESTIKHYLGNYILINSAKDIAEEEIAVLVRYVNFVPDYRKKAIVFNGLVIHSPEPCNLCERQLLLSAN